MTEPTYFTVVADYKSVVADLPYDKPTGDVDADPTLGPVTARVIFTPVLRNGDVILATDASPRPTGFVPAPIIGRIDDDGRLKLRVDPDGDRDDYPDQASFPATGSTSKVYFSIADQTFYRWTGTMYVQTYPYTPIRLLADTALLELDSALYYRVTFSDVIYNGGPGYIAPFTFQAPTGDVELNLIEVMRQPGQPATGITKIGPSHVRLQDGTIIFSFAGVDLDDPVLLEPTFTAAEMTDATAIGLALVTTPNAAAARGYIGAVTSNDVAEQIVAEDIPGQVAAAVADAGTVVAAAAEAVTAEIAAYAEVLPVSTDGYPHPLIETDADGVRITRYVDAAGHTWIHLNGEVDLPGEQITDGSITEPKFAPEVSIPRTSTDITAFSIADQEGRLSELTIDNTGRLAQWAVESIADRTQRTYTRYTLKADGSGDYSTLADAVSELGAGSPRQWIELVVYPGTYSAYQVELPDNWKITGINRDLCILQGENDDDATDAEIELNSTLQIRKNNELHNITVTARNLRYPIHDESYGADTDGTVVLVNCHIEHLGNQGARDWRTANPGSGLSAATVWGAETAWGHGTSSGNVRTFIDTTFAGRDRSWYMHDNKDFTQPARYKFRNCELAARTFAATLLVESLGSGQPSLVSMLGTSTSGLAVEYADTPWISVADDNQVANHAQIEVSLDGLDPLGFTTSNRGKALKIESASTSTTSTIRVSGTAATAIFGQPTHRDGGGGLKGYLYGQWDISGILCGAASDTATKNTLGRRLGDCSSVSKTLTVTVDGGSPISVTFSTNLTSASNASILATINAALGSAATASEYLVTQGEVYPRFTSRIKRMVNHSATGIPRWSAVKQDGSRGIALMGIGDPATAFYGVTLEPIAPNVMGRVLTSGRLQTATQMSGLSTSPSSGTVYFSDTTAGAFALSGTRPAGTVDFPGWATFTGSR